METKSLIEYKYARLAGLGYVIFTIAGLVKNFLLNSRLSKIDTSQTNGLFENEMHFRLGIALETIMFLGVVLASVSFYVLLKTVNKQLSLMTLCLRLCEIILGGIAVVINIAILAIASKAYFIEMFELEQLKIIAAVASGFRTPAYEYSWIFMGFAGVITFHMLFSSRYIPRAWSIWGIITYISLIVYPIAKVLFPGLPPEAVFVLFPGALFELGVGTWLAFIGVSIPIKDSNASNKLPPLRTASDTKSAF